MKKLLTLLTVMLGFAIGAWADDTSTLTFTSACGGTGTADDGVVWTVTSDGDESTFDNTKGIHYGTGSKAVKYIKLSTSDITGTITSVKVNASTANGVSATVDVTIGGEAFGGDAQSLTNSAADYTFNGSAAGEIVVTVTKPESAVKALYVKSVAVTYVKSEGGGGDEQPTTKTVTFENDARWADVYVWAWNDEQDGQTFMGTEWPGVEITPVDGVYTWSTTGNPTKIIFNNGSGGEGNQTADLDFEDGATYNSKGKVVPLKDFSVTFTTNLGWEKVYAYTWTGEDDAKVEQAGAWPGKEITETQAEGVYTYAFQATEAPANIIFNDGTTGGTVGENQTADLTFTNGKAYALNVNKIPNIAKLIALDDKTEFKFTGAALVVAKPTGKYVYIKDETGSSLIYDAGGDGESSKTTAAEVGKTIAPNWTGKVSFYNVLFEAVPDAALTMKEGAPVEVTYPEVAADYVKAENVNQVITIKGLTISAVSGKNITFALGDATIAGYNQFGLTLPEDYEGKTFDVVGAIGRYNDNIQFQPITLQENEKPAAPIDVEDGYYLVGTMNEWTPAQTDELTANTEADGEYMITLDMTTGAKIKVVKIENKAIAAWYPDGEGNDYEITKDANYTVYFRPAGNAEWANGYFYVAENVPVVAQTATFNFADPNFRENIGEAMADTKGYIYNETFTADGATLQITAGSAPSRIYVDNSRGQNLVTYKEYTTLTFKAPEGKAITKIEFTAAGNSNINNFTASSGTIDGMVWTGNADGVRFTQGATSYLANAIVTLADKDAETTALPAIEYTEVANIAAFNALEAGTYAKITLTVAEVIGKSADGYSTVWVQDATGGAWIQYTSLNDKLQEKTKINGTIYTIKRANSGNSQLKEAEATIKSEFTAEAIDAYTTVEGTIAEVNVAANLNKVVKISGATLAMTSNTAGTLTLGETTISVNNGTETANQQLHKIADWKKDKVMENVTIVAILSAKSDSENQLLPISIEGSVVIKSMAILGDFLGLEATETDEKPNWNPANGWEMTQDEGNPSIWTLTVKDFEAEAKKYEYKATANDKWGDYELPGAKDANENGNAEFIFGTGDYPAGKYNLTFTANTEQHTLALVAEKVMEPQPEAVYTLVGSFTKWNVEENKAGEEIAIEGLFASIWDAENAENPNTMELNEETGKYTLSFTNIELPAAGNINYKVVKNHSWTENWGTNDGENCYYWIGEAGKYSITFTFDLNADITAGAWYVSCEATKTGDATGIATIKAAQENGAAIYTLQGVRVNNVKKGGMYIVNGKKVAIK